MPASIDFLPEFQRRRLAEFRERLRVGRAAVLIGAGVSRRAGQPDGPTLARSLSKGQGLPPETGDDLIATCDALEKLHGRPWLNQELARLLDNERLPLSDVHQLLARIAFSAYYTTNVDRLMEWALMDGGRSFSTVFLDPDAALMGGGKTPVVKLHGAIDHPHTMVFTSGDFDAFSGLAPYGVGGRDFFGRDAPTQALAERLPSLSPVTVFFGDSGCGKTSFFQAGLSRELERRGALWTLVGTALRSDPMARLEEAVRAKLGESRAAPWPDVSAPSSGGASFSPSSWTSSNGCWFPNPPLSRNVSSPAPCRTLSAASEALCGC
jgi:NAD-dependent SIR2 family protein deacetylase